MRKRTLAREYALKILYRTEISKDSAESSSQDFWSQKEYDQDIKDFAKSLVKGTHENLSKIDEIISRHADNWEL
ncbi:MAG: transcription antitermination factor NusB, partial [Candidatus Omnitrophota bacterium]